MLVQMKTHITGTRDGVEWPIVGGTLEVPDHEGNDLVTAGLAEEVTDASTPTEDSGQPTAEEADAATPNGGAAAPAEDGDEPVKPKRTRKASR